jgi:hypothetical protein
MGIITAVSRRVMTDPNDRGLLDIDRFFDEVRDCVEEESGWRMSQVEDILGPGGLSRTGALSERLRALLRIARAKFAGVAPADLLGPVTVGTAPGSANAVTSSEPIGPAHAIPPDGNIRTHAAEPPRTEIADLVTLEQTAAETHPLPDLRRLATTLRRQRKPIQAALLEFTADKEKAAAEEIAVNVHNDQETSDAAMRMNARRTNDSLVALGSRLSFRLVSGYMFREVCPK